MEKKGLKGKWWALFILIFGNVVVMNNFLEIAESRVYVWLMSWGKTVLSKTEISNARPFWELCVTWASVMRFETDQVLVNCILLVLIRRVVARFTKGRNWERTNINFEPVAVSQHWDRVRGWQNFIVSNTHHILPDF